VSILDERKFSVPQAAKALGVCKDLVYDMIRDGEVRAMRIRRKFVIAESELLRVCEDAVYTPSTKGARLEKPKRISAADLLPAGEHSSTGELEACLQGIRGRRRRQTGSRRD